MRQIFGRRGDAKQRSGVALSEAHGQGVQRMNR
jgi:hypothetical protein